MRFDCTARTRRALALASAVALPTLFCGHALAQTFPTTVYTAAASGNAYLTLGVSGSFNSSNTNVAPLVDQDSSILAGYVLSSTSVLTPTRELYNFNIGTGTSSLIALADSVHTTSSSLPPTLAIVTSNGLTVGTQDRIDPAFAVYPGPQEGEDVIESNNGASPIAVPLPATVLSGNASYAYTDTKHDNAIGESLIAAAGTTSANNFNTNAANSSGVIAGQVTRYAGNGATTGGQPDFNGTLGADGFYYDPSTQLTTTIGLAGGVYDNTYSTTSISPAGLINHATTVTGTAGTVAAAGYTNRVDNTAKAALGRDAWYYTPASGTQAIGLVGGNYTTITSDGQGEQISTTYRTNSLGQVAGGSVVKPINSIGGSAGNDFWLYTPPSTPGSTPGTASTYGTSSAGTYERLGLFVTPSGTTVGNILPSTTFRNSNITFLTNSGTAAGISNRYDASGTSEGSAAWYFNGSTNLDISPNAINPSDTLHAAVAGGVVSSTNAITAMNNTGMVAGTATRIAGTTSGSAALGQDAYVYDSNNGKEYFADPVDAASTTNYEYSYIGVLSDAGYAVGFYNTYSGSASNTQTNTTLFVWSELGGLQPLSTFANTGTNTATNPTAATLQTYATAFQFGSDGELYGPNTFQASASISATSLVAYGLNVTWDNSLGSATSTTWDTTTQNWTNGVIPLVYINSAIVTFNDANNGHYAVTLNSAVTPNAVTFNNSAGNYTLSGTGGIGGAGGLTKMGTGSVTLSTKNTYTGATNVSGGAIILAAAGALPTGTNLNIASGASVIASNLGTEYGLTVGTLSVAGLLDINNNGLIIRNSSIGYVTSLLHNGYNDGAWNGTSGIVSTTAANDPAHLTALGVMINDTGGNANASTGTAIYNTSSNTATVDGNILVKYTYYGDANLSGSVDSVDYALIDNGYLKSLTGWYNGDFNYDGVINGSDYTLIDNAFNTQGASLAAAVATAQIAGPGATSAVPEPTAMGVLAVSAGLLGRRRRR